MIGIEILKGRCTSCGLCLSECPFGAIIMDGDVVAITDACTLCGACQEGCPSKAILFERKTVSREDVSEYKGILVYAEQSRKVTYELLGEARRLADKLGCNVSAVLIGKDLQGEAQELISFGADVVFAADNPSLALFNDEIHAHILTELIRQHKPEIVLIGATIYGRSIAPRVSARLDTGLTADCTLLDIEDGTGVLLQTRPAFGGNLMATIVCRERRPQMATVRPGILKPLPVDVARQGTVVFMEVKFPKSVRTKVVDVFLVALGDVNLGEAEVVVAVGKGIGSQDNMSLAEDLAKVLGGVVGASRAVVDAGWIEYSRQIGQTGKTVAPKLYIACGLSGAVQHTAGMVNAETIVAINKDPDAPIFKIAHVGIVGDVRHVLPEITKLIKEKKA
ncbi:MAG: electron transfer flavoprotein alpha subunit [Bacillota bacterium]|nr:MAG: electron transfer flavoprotein alpha subunit [Bacillota bacterium]